MKEPTVHPVAAAIASEIAMVRSRLISNLPETIEQEDGMTDGELADAAAVYALAGGAHRKAERATTFNWFWPWPRESFGLSTRRATLLHAASLIVAEIERLDRAVKKAAAPTNHMLDGEGAEPMRREGDA